MSYAANLCRIDDAAQLTGTTPSVLRIWEVRYAWPTPARDPSNGYRYYSQHLIDQIRRVVELTKAGHDVGSLIVDGQPRWPKRNAQPNRVWARYAMLELPYTEVAITFRRRLEAALRRRDIAAATTALHTAFIVLRPGERMIAAWMPAVFAAREWELAERPLERDVERLVIRLAGEGAMRLIDDRWNIAART